MAKKRQWKFWVSRTLLGMIILAGAWLVNLIWFKPFNIRNFYDKIFLELALSDPELVTQLGIAVLYDFYKADSSNVSDEKTKADFEMLKANYQTLKSYDFDDQSKENKLNTRILGSFLSKQIEGRLTVITTIRSIKCLGCKVIFQA